ncbi:MAG: hypothetical protein AB7L09_26515 [Nitrospira sp.]
MPFLQRFGLDLAIAPFTPYGRLDVVTKKVDERLPPLRVHKAILDCDEPGAMRFSRDNWTSEPLLSYELDPHRLLEGAPPLEVGVAASLLRLGLGRD